MSAVPRGRPAPGCGCGHGLGICACDGRAVPMLADRACPVRCAAISAAATRASWQACLVGCGASLGDAGAAAHPQQGEGTPASDRAGHPCGGGHVHSGCVETRGNWPCTAFVGEKSVCRLIGDRRAAECHALGQRLAGEWGAACAAEPGQFGIWALPCCVQGTVDHHLDSIETLWRGRSVPAHARL